AWAATAGLPVSDRGRLRPDVWEAYRAANPPATR
ncbi:MAG: Lsr2 family protein, partial [Actinobacteria bacterium]|nr:Lsr2 family protein [Actinomycetota bacterium]